jgi:hypothetical protein
VRLERHRVHVLAAAVVAYCETAETGALRASRSNLSGQVLRRDDARVQAAPRYFETEPLGQP